MDPRRPDKQQKYKPPQQSASAGPGEDLTPDYMNILDTTRKTFKSLHKRNDRFKVVKIESAEPFKRGRWECMDFLDQSYERMAHYNSVVFKTSDTNLMSPAQNEDLSNSMLQIFYQQNLGRDEGRREGCEMYVVNENGNYVLMPGLVSTSLVGIQYPFELNFLSSDSAENLMKTVSETEISLSNCDLQNDDSLKTNNSCHGLDNFDSKQISTNRKMSSGNIHYMQQPQNGEIQSGQDVKQSEQINQEIYNNTYAISIPVNGNVIQPPPNTSTDIYQPVEPPIDPQYKPSVIPQPQNVVYQQQIYPAPNEQLIQSNINDGVIAQNFPSEVHQNYQMNECGKQPQQIINKSVMANNLTIRTHTYDVIPEVKTNVYHGNSAMVHTQVNPQVNVEFDSNQIPQRIHEEVHYQTAVPNQNQQNLQQNPQKVPQNGRYYSEYQQEIRQPQQVQVNIANMEVNDNGVSPVKVQNLFHQCNKTDVNYQKIQINEKTILLNATLTKNEEHAQNSRPSSAKGSQETELGKKDLCSNKFTCSNSSQQFSFIPEVIPDNSSQTSVNNNVGHVTQQVNPIYAENSTMVAEQQPVFIPSYPIIQNPIYVPVFSNAVQIPVCVPTANSCEQAVSETALNRKPISYQRVYAPPPTPNMIKRPPPPYFYQNTTPTHKPPTEQSFDPHPIDPSPAHETPHPIDVKIEALMDLVKKHLKFTIMEDVHGLRQKILVLKERIAQLEYENELLRSAHHDDAQKKYKEKL